MKDKENIINSLLDESDSQKDRNNLETTKSLNLINFLNSQIEKSNAKNSLRDDVIGKLKKKFIQLEKKNNYNLFVKAMSYIH